MLNAATDKTSTVGNPTASLDPVALIQHVPLFDGLSAEVMTELTAQAQTVTFLMGDVVIGRNEKGNALYIIMHGTVEVFQEDNSNKTLLGTLTRGEFFGEAALLGDEVRTATVTAKISLTLLRLTRRNVLSLAEKYKDIAARLKQAHEGRHEVLVASG